MSPPSLSLFLCVSLVVPLSLSIPHPRRMSLSGFHGDPVAVVLLLLRRKKRVRERGRGSGERGEARRSSESAGGGVTPPIRGK